MSIRKPVRRLRLSALATALGVVLGGLVGGSAQALSVSMTGWSAETWNNGANYWSLDTSGTSALYTSNSNPSVLTGGGSLLNSQISFQLSVTNGSGGDDDFFGFVLGYDAGGIRGAAGSEFLLIDWKRQTQSSGPATAQRGLALSQVGTLTSAFDLWGHESSVTELARGATLGTTGWTVPRSYAFDVVYTGDRVQVSVDGVTQFDLAGNFSDGTFGFYNYSQAGIRYGDLDITPLPPKPQPPGQQTGPQTGPQTPPLPAVPLPASLPLLMAAIGGLGVLRRRS